MIQAQLRATRIVLQVLKGRSLTATLSEARAHHIDALSSTVQDLTYGVLRHLGFLRAIAYELAERRIEDTDIEVLLLVALYQLEFNRTVHHAVVDNAVHNCTALRKNSAKGFINAVLRNFLRRHADIVERARQSDVGRWSYPQWWIDALRSAYPACFAQILEAGNVHPPMTLRVNTRRTDCSAYLRVLEQHGLNASAIGPTAVMLEHPVAVDRVPGFQEGVVSVQDLSAQYAAPLLDLRPGMRVLDACAAPGGKTAHIAELCDVDLTALDRDAGRLERVAQTLSRLSLQANLVNADAAQLGTWWDAIPFDRILLDAPCTASGIVRRHPDIKWLRRPSDIDTLAASQHVLLTALWRALARGGKLLYATCSVFPEETRLQLSAFLEAHPDAVRLDPSGILDIGNIEGQILPDPRHDGFFYALLQKH